MLYKNISPLFLRMISHSKMNKNKLVLEVIKSTEVLYWKFWNVKTATEWTLLITHRINSIKGTLVILNSN